MLKELDASKAIKDRLREAVVAPLTSGDVAQIRRWVKAVIAYSPATLELRLRHVSQLREEVLRLPQGMH
jgi:hypothetical protein